MSGYFTKSPGSNLDYTFDWGFQFLDPGETITADLGWTVTPDDAGGVQVQSNTSTATTTTAFLGGGEAGHAYLVRSRIATSTGRTVERALTLRISNN